MKSKKGKNSHGKKVTRREFLKVTASLGAAATVPCVIQIFNRPSFAAGKTVRVLLTPDPKITPGTMTSGGAVNVASCIYDWLFRQEGQEQKFTNSLAESTQHSPDMTQWTFKLREKVKFHHGTEFTADDVIFTIKRLLDESVGSPLRMVFSHVNKIEKLGRYLVRFHLKSPDPDFLLKFLDKNAAILAQDYDYSKFGNTKPSGTGAFKVVQYTPGQRMVLERNPDYFVPGLPKSENLEIVFIQEVQTQVMTLASGQGDTIRALPFDFLMRYQNHPNLEIHRLSSAYFAPITVRCDEPPFNDNRVRQAMKLVVDRKRMLETVCLGYGEVANDDYVWSKNNWHNNIGLKDRDIDKAKELLAQAGYPKGIDLEIFCESNRPPCMDVVLTYQEMAKPAGINVQVRGVTSDIYYAKYFMKAPAVCDSWGHREPLDLLAVMVKTGAPWNHGRYSNPNLDKMIDEAMSEVDPIKRKEIFKRIQLLLSEEGPSIIPFFHNVFAATRKGVKGFQLTLNWINDYRAIEVL